MLLILQFPDADTARGLVVGDQLSPAMLDIIGSLMPGVASACLMYSSMVPAEALDCLTAKELVSLVASQADRPPPAPPNDGQPASDDDL